MRSSGKLPTLTWTLCLLGTAWFAARGFLPTSAYLAAAETADDKLSLESILKELSGSDQQSALVAAQGLVQQASLSPEHKKIFDQLLKPSEVLESREKMTAAERLVGVMGYQAADKGLSDDNATKLLDLVGQGPESLRRAVRAALLNQIRAELQKSGGTSATFEELGLRIKHNNPPPRNVLRDASSIVWEVDGKALLGFLVEGMVANRALFLEPQDRDKVAGYILELRDRLRTDFATVEAWEAWWKEQGERSLEAILAEVRKVEDAKRVELWRRNVQRIKESASPERYLACLIDSFALDPGPNLRLAVLNEFATFPVWLQETRFTPGVLTDADRETYLRQGVRFLLAILKGEREFQIVALDVKAASVAAISPFGGAILRGDDLAGDVPNVLLQALQDLKSSPAWNADERRYALELVRALGSLRVVNGEVREFLEKLLGDKALVEVEVERDPELSAEAVAALGKLLARGDDPVAVEKTVELFLAVHATAQGKTADLQKSKTWADLRKACVTAMNVPVEEEALRGKVRAVYAETLERPEGKSERIPSIIGLGILGKAGDEESVELLTDILRRRSQFEVGEVNAVVNALAYLGEAKALGCFLDFLVVKDQPFSDQIWKKVVSIVKGGNPELLGWLVDEFEKRGFERDSAEFYRATVRLANEPGLSDAFASDKVNLDDPELLRRFWILASAQIRAQEIVGEEKQATAELAELKAFVVKDEKVAQLLPTAKAELARTESRLALKLDAVASLTSDPPLAPAVVEQKFLAILDEAAGSAEDGSSSRSRWQAVCWLRQRLAAMSAAFQQQIGAAAHAYLSKPESKAFWDGIDPTIREQSLKRLLGSD